MARKLQFQFVTVSDPTQPACSESRKVTHSHVMRQAHARKRHLEIQRYQNESRICSSGTKQDVTTLKVSLLSSPLSNQVNDSIGKDPFSSLARPLTSEEYFLLDHCMLMFKHASRAWLWARLSQCPKLVLYTLDPLRFDAGTLTKHHSNPKADIKIVTPYSIGHCGLFDCPGDHKTQMLREWVGLAITDDALMVAAVLLSTCRSILLDRPDHPVFTRMALQYKQICLRTLRQEITALRQDSINVMTVAKAVALAIDEVRTVACECSSDRARTIPKSRN